jgi:hypothetical protein
MSKIDYTNPLRAREEANISWGQLFQEPTYLSYWTPEPKPIPEKAVTAKGTKYDDGKPPMALLDPEYLEGVARVLGFGADRYGPDNWRGGIGFRRLISAAQRHLNSINKGEDIDSDSGEQHAFHLGCCAMFLSWMINHRKDLDDRYREIKVEIKA